MASGRHTTIVYCTNRWSWRACLAKAHPKRRNTRRPLSKPVTITPASSRRSALCNRATANRAAVTREKLVMPATSCSAPWLAICKRLADCSWPARLVRELRSLHHVNALGKTAHGAAVWCSLRPKDVSMRDSSPITAVAKETPLDASSAHRRRQLLTSKSRFSRRTLATAITNRQS